MMRHRGAARASALDAVAVRTALRSASVTLGDRRATGAELEHAGRVTRWLDFVPNPECRRLVSADAFGYSLTAIERATGIAAEVVQARIDAAIAQIVAALQ